MKKFQVEVFNPLPLVRDWRPVGRAYKRVSSALKAASKLRDSFRVQGKHLAGWDARVNRIS